MAAPGEATTQVQTVIVQQQAGPQNWKHDTCNCFAAGGMGCLYCCCCPCINYACATTKLNPGNSFCWECIRSSFLAICCTQCMRQEVREAYNITGSCCGDIICCCCCYSCTGVQMHAEVIVQNMAQGNQNVAVVQTTTTQ